MSKPGFPRKLIRTFDLLRHRGDKYTCPFCGYHAKDLAVAGLDFPVFEEKQVVGAGRRYALCYKCGSSDRERLVFVYLKEYLHVFQSPENLRVLHIAPERNLSRSLLEAGFAEYICGDLSTQGFPSHVRQMSVLDIPFPDNHFDLVICNHVMEHVPDDRAAMRSIYRVLKPGGQAILQVPISITSMSTFEDLSVTDPEQRETHFGQRDHVRLYGQDYRQRLASCGFQTSVVNIATSYPRLGLDPREDIFVNRKQI